MGVHHSNRLSPVLRAPNSVGHDEIAPALLTGYLELALISEGVSPGTGKLGLDERGVLAHRASRRGGLPILPGTGLKGAVRTRYEMITHSCDPLVRGCRGPSYCPACSLFGGVGWSGRLFFADATPANQTAVSTKTVRVTTPWEPGKGPGDFRYYDGYEKAPPPGEGLTREIYSGRFVTRMSFRNARAEELGLVLLGCGLDDSLTMRFPLILGGARYDGFGKTRLEPGRLMLMGSPPGKSAEEGRHACHQWIDAAKNDSGFGKSDSVLAALARRLKGGGL